MKMNNYNELGIDLTDDESIIETDVIIKGAEIDAQFAVVTYLHDMVDYEQINTMLVITVSIDGVIETTFVGEANKLYSMLENSKIQLTEQLKELSEKLSPK